jgi:hypothetical protein
MFMCDREHLHGRAGGRFRFIFDDDDDDDDNDDDTDDDDNDDYHGDDDNDDDDNNDGDNDGKDGNNNDDDDVYLNSLQHGSGLQNLFSVLFHIKKNTVLSQ